MDIGSVVKADRTASSSSQNNSVSANDLAAKARVQAQQERQQERTNIDRTPLSTPFDPVWSQDSVTKTETVNSRLVEESEFRKELRDKQELLNAQKREEYEEKALEKAKEAIAKLNQRQVALRFEASEDFEDRQVVNVVDTKLDKVVRQIPSDEFLKIADNIAKYQERIEHDDMVADPVLKALGIDQSNVNEALRGAVIDDLA